MTDPPRKFFRRRRLSARSGAGAQTANAPPTHIEGKLFLQRRPEAVSHRRTMTARFTCSGVWQCVCSHRFSERSCAMADPRSAPVHWVLITVSMAILAGGCRSTGPLLKSEHFDFVTTGLFSEPCKDSEAIKQARREERRARRGYESNAAAGECNLPRSEERRVGKECRSRGAGDH